MKIGKWILKALSATAFTAAVSVGCTGLEPYTIDAPDDLAEKIAAYKAEKEAGKSDDYEEITITTAIVGAEDNTSGWWSEFSQYFNVPSGKKLFVEFENFGSGANNWNNWNACVANGKERDTDGYSEYFVIRSDAYGWGNADYNGAVIEFDYGGGEVNWDEFREKMQGATVTLSLDHARAGAAFLEVHSVAADGFDIVEKYNQKVSATEDINLFLIADGSHFNMKKAWLVPSEIAEIPDETAASIVVTGLPESVEIGSPVDAILANAAATVTFTDNSSTAVPIEDVTFSLTEDFTATLGTKTLVYSYSKTKQGNYGTSVAGYAQIEVTNPVVELQIAQAPLFTTYYFFDNTALDFRTAGLEVTAVYADGTTGSMPVSNLTFSPIEIKEGAQEVTLSYKEASATCTINLVKGAYAVGAPDFTNGWWTTFTPDFTVAAGESKVFEMDLYSDNLENYHSPCTIVRKADMTEYLVVREDHFGWGDSYAGATAESNWNWDYFRARLNNSHVTITVTNNGDNTASIRYEVIDSEGESHFQNYLNFAVDSADVNCCLVTEESYLVLVD
ncbi:MAG: hypothetical protein IKH17_05125 [Bacteroidales bacterium]|jgi:hypothetical protein|nr:hypothetical protein [Bacteroidales bacterium]